MIRLSSSLTLGIALFLPVFWFVFFGCLTLFILVTDSDDLPITNVGMFKMGFLICFIVFAFLIYKVPAKLKRVELDDDQLFVTNYFKTIRLPLQQVSKINERPMFRLILVTLILESKSFFGKKIRFLCNAEKYQLLVNQYKMGKGI